MKRTHYEILGVAETATVEQIKAGYRARAKACHPDRNGGAKASEDELKEVNAAYDALGDEDRRSAYDAELFVERGEEARRRAAAAARTSAFQYAPPSPSSTATGRGSGLTPGQVLGGTLMGLGTVIVLDALFGGSSRRRQPRGPDGRFR